MRGMNPAIVLAVLLLYFLPLVLGGLSSSAIARGDFPEDFVFGSGTSAYQAGGQTIHQIFSAEVLVSDSLYFIVSPHNVSTIGLNSIKHV
ncbi:Beta-glucosidase 5 [Platanthera zijinensis]|uniref:Beta-glucosidase 5 n=1 Tax=Platanthera zijinensis TaxID=2320716 RepID=A0AAP0FZQ4_9ASPA